MKQPTKVKAIYHLQGSLNAIDELKQEPYDAQGFERWRRSTRTAIVYAFGDEHDYVNEFSSFTFDADSWWASWSEDRVRQFRQNTYVNQLALAASLLDLMIDEIEKYWEIESHSLPSAMAQEINPSNISEVFVVHGRDDGTKNTVARFLERLGLQPVVLAELPSQGRTIIEKFERHAQVAFAVVLLTPDDAGSLRDEEDTPNPRARQNVIFEMGFFIGKLGRDRVCALTEDIVEIPSDYAGVVYIPLDESEGWKLALVRELQKAGLAVDANQAI